MEGTLSILGVLIFVLLSVAFMTVAERKYLSSIQRRRGPNVVGWYGLGQAIADGLKLITKETIKPSSAESSVYWVSPCITFMVSVGS